jgi:hypothetical protein
MKPSKKDIKRMEQLYKDVEKFTIIDKKILDSIDREKCILGKELMLCEQIHAVNSSVLGKEARYQIILYLIRLFSYNLQVHQSLTKELENDKELLKKRVEKAMREKKVHNEIFDSVMKVADNHFNSGKEHLKHIRKEDSSTHYHAHLALNHKNKAEELYNTLMDKNIKRVMQKVAMIKLESTYKKLLEKCESLASMISQSIRSLEKGTQKNMSFHHLTQQVFEQNLLLRQFAVNYSKSLVHAAEYRDHLNNKIVIYVHR